MALSFDDVLDSLKKAGVEPAKTQKVLENLKSIEIEKKEEAAEEKEAGPKKKNQYVVFVMDDGTLTNKELLGYVLQIPEDKSPASATEMFNLAVRSYNTTTRKGRKYPVTKVGEGMQIVKGKHLKNEKGEKLAIKTKEAILVIPVSNEIKTPQTGVPQAD